jgi:hypothetical protein
MPCLRNMRSAWRVRVDQLLVRPRDFATEVGDLLAAVGLLTTAVLVTMASFFLL